MAYNIVASHEALRRSYKSGQQWQFRNGTTNYEWRDRPGEPGWFLDTEYRQKPDIAPTLKETDMEFKDD